LLEDILLQQSLRTIGQEVCDAVFSHAQVLLIVGLFKNFEYELGFRLYGETVPRPTRSGLNTVFGGSNGEAASVAPGRMFNVEAWNTTRAVVLDDIACRYRLAVIGSTCELLSL
jgi:hypothetical protein